MKRVCMALATCGLAAFAFDLGAQPPERERDGERPRSERRERDRDRDRGDRSDGDRDFRRSRFGSFRMPPNPVVAAIDANSNGELSEEEIKNAPKALMALDKNGDKKLSGDEIRPQFGPGGPGGPGGPFGDPAQFITRIMESDANGDGKLSREEMPERMRQGFGRLDSNNDGFVDRAELEELSRRFQRGPGGPPGQRDRDRGDRDGNDRERPDRDSDSPSRDDL